MKKLLILSAILVSAWSAVAQPWQQPEIVSKADRSTVEFVVRDAKPILMDIYQFKDRKTEGGRPVFIYSFGGAGCLSTHSILYLANSDAARISVDAANLCYVDYLRENLKPNSCKLYMDRGDQTLDAQYPKYQDRLDKMFKEAGWDDAHYISKVYPGHAHEEKAWSARLEVPVLFLLGK